MTPLVGILKMLGCRKSVPLQSISMDEVFRTYKRSRVMGEKQTYLIQVYEKVDQLDKAFQVKRQFLVEATSPDEADQLFNKVVREEEEAGEPIVKNGENWTIEPVIYEREVFEI